MRYMIKVVLFICLFLSVSLVQVVNAEAEFEGKLDSLEEGAVVQSNQLQLRGWALHKDRVEHINVYLDDQFVGEATYGISREDVALVYPTIQGSEKSGYQMVLDLSKNKDRDYIITIEAVTKSGLKGIITKTKFVKSDPIEGAIEAPLKELTLVKGNHLDVQGWVSSEKKIKSIQVLLNGHFIGNAHSGIAREDIKKLYTHVELNSGFQYTLDVSKVYKGIHTIQVIAEFDDGTTSEVGEKAFKKQFNYPMLILLIILATGTLFIYKFKKKKVKRQLG
ncbi:hypothetical protein [Paenibacillus sp. sgz302251]|uniref:hypothetical protein n=1 Tax=Paenibacillus sp. sgz302251 TaxID=3414493 RepID=UPI003C7BE602